VSADIVKVRVIPCNGGQSDWRRADS
jgi:hypothetical protein